ncbi:MAG: galactokinase [Halanaerobiales bacterium]
MEKIEKLWKVFKDRYGDNGMKKGAFSAPGRVNLIGEHTDYNDGFVLPMAIEKNITMVAQLRDDKKVVAYDVNFEPEMSFDLDNIKKAEENTWINYLMGVAKEIQDRGHELQGMNVVIEGNVPLSSGLSSSAALEVVTGITFENLNEIEIEPVEMALLCQSAENNFVGVNCGIMDQYISRLGKKGHALMIDCRTNEYELVPFTDEKYRIIICNTNVQRELVDSAYNQRREECNQAAAYFAEKLDHEVIALRDVSLIEFEEYKDGLSELETKRAKHVISENDRVKESIEALKEDKFERFGELMIQSHESLRDDYEVSCKELDIMVDLALEVEGTLGSRMTGAGFGGCTVSLVKKEAVNDFKEKVAAGYKQATGIETDIYVSSPADGARVIELE